MMNSDAFFAQPEIDYRRDRVRKSVAASRGNRSRSSWLRRIAAADKTVR